MQNYLFSDFDAFSCHVNDVDCTMMLLNPSRRVWSVTHLDLPGIHIQLGQLGSGNLLAGQSVSHGYLFYVPLSNECEYLANGSAFRRGRVWLLEPGAEFHLSTMSQHDWCTVLIPSELLVLGDGFTGLSAGTERPTCRVLAPDKHFASSLEGIVRDTILAATRCDTFEKSFAAERAAVALITLARSVLGESLAKAPLKQGRPAASRRAILNSCRELVEERCGEQILVSDLVTTAGVSERLLRNVFIEYLGVSPKRYLQLRQLHSVHQTLLRADAEETSVTKVLVALGEWQFGRFAAQYRQLFGVNPSVTLAQKPVAARRLQSTTTR